jgi:hypothetical protein
MSVGKYLYKNQPEREGFAVESVIILLEEDHLWERVFFIPALDVVVTSGIALANIVNIALENVATNTKLKTVPISTAKNLLQFMLA